MGLELDTAEEATSGIERWRKQPVVETAAMGGSVGGEAKDGGEVIKERHCIMLNQGVLVDFEIDNVFPSLEAASHGVEVAGVGIAVAYYN